MTNLLHSKYADLARELLMRLHDEDLASLVKTATCGRIVPVDSTEACTAVLLSCPDVAKLLSHRKLSSVFLLQYLTRRGIVIRGHATRMQLVMTIVQHWEETVKRNRRTKREDPLERAEPVLYTTSYLKQESIFEPECIIKSEPEFYKEKSIKKEPLYGYVSSSTSASHASASLGSKFTGRGGSNVAPSVTSPAASTKVTKPLYRATLQSHFTEPLYRTTLQNHFTEPLYREPLNTSYNVQSHFTEPLYGHVSRLSLNDFSASQASASLGSKFTGRGGSNVAPSVTSPAANTSSSVNKVHVNSRNNGNAELIRSDEFAHDFCVWFYMMVNKLQPCCADQAGDSLRPEIFCGNSCLEMYLVDGERMEQCKASSNVECNKVMRELLAKLGLLFMPNAEGGIHVKKSSHGIIQVSCCGTIHCNDSFVGIFEQEFGLVASPVDRSWKIAYSKINLKKLLMAHTPTLPRAEVFAIEY